MQNINWLHSRKQGSYDCIKKKTDKQTPKCHGIRRKGFQLRMAIHKLSDSLIPNEIPFLVAVIKFSLKPRAKIRVSLNIRVVELCFTYLCMIKKISQLNRLRKSTFYLLNIRHNSKLQTEILTSEANAIFNFVFIIELVLKKQKQINI